jgi:uncharacterized membrane protein required for colicin V production
MAFIILAALLILGIAFYQVLQGLFSALIMTILTIIAAAIAFNYYEPLGEMLAARMPGYADGVALLAVFVVPLLAMRILYDRFIGGNVVLGMWADRIGGGVLGLVSGMILVGVLAIIIQMLPFDRRVITFKPFDEALARQSSLAPFYPDEFTLGLVKTLSAGSLSGERSYEQAHEDLPRELFAWRNDADLNGRVDTVPGTLTVDGAWSPPPEIAFLADAPNYPPLGRNVVTRTVIVRTTIGEDARDEDRWFRLPGTHFRLVTQGGESFYPVGHVTYSGGAKVDGAPIDESTAQLTLLKVLSEGTSVTVDWVYQLPMDAKPQYMVFRRAAKDDVDEVKGTVPPAIPAAPAGD